jgi:hypothetical protein
MTDTAHELPGIERIKLRFLNLLEDRQSAVAHHAMAAWDTTDPEIMCGELEAAQNILHQISGSAGSLGFGDLGQAARDCENEIITYLEQVGSTSADVPVVIMGQMDQFVSMSRNLISA